jgi:hypothetical protein
MQFIRRNRRPANNDFSPLAPSTSAVVLRDLSPLDGKLDRKQANSPTLRPKRWPGLLLMSTGSSRSYRWKDSSSSHSRGMMIFEECLHENTTELTTDMNLLASGSTHPMDKSDPQPFSISMASQYMLESCNSSNNDPVSYEIEKHQLDELGYLRFRYTCLADALTAEKTNHKPVFYFQAQVPGDVYAGREIFSHPLIVEAAETLFVTVCCPPSCIQQLPMPRTLSGKICCTRVNLLDEIGRPLVPLVSGDELTRAGLVSAMVRALETSGLPVPRYLSLFLQEEMGRMNLGASGETRLRSSRVCFAMRDPAVAEADFGGLCGVLATRAGSMDQQKVVEVTYDSKLLSFGALVRFALQHKAGDVTFYRTNEERMAATIEVCRAQQSSAVVAYDHSFKACYDPKHALRRTPMRFVPLTPLQATRANRLIHYGSFDEAVQLLSPRQGMILTKAMRITAQKLLHEVVDETILLAWKSVCYHEHPKVLQHHAEPLSDDSDDDDNVYN